MYFSGKGCSGELACPSTKNNEQDVTGKIMTEQKKTTIKDFLSIAMLSSALVFGLTHMPSSADDPQAGANQTAQLTPSSDCSLQLADASSAP